VQPLASPLGYRARHLQRVLGSSGRSSRRLPASGRGFNRMAVEAALRRAVALWGRLKLSEHANGAIFFCSEEVAEAVHPLQPLQRRLYRCGKRFKTEVLHEQLEVEKSPAYGLIVIDGSDAIIGTAHGLGMVASSSMVCKLAHLQSTQHQRRAAVVSLPCVTPAGWGGSGILPPCGRAGQRCAWWCPWTCLGGQSRHQAPTPRRASAAPAQEGAVRG